MSKLAVFALVLLALTAVVVAQSTTTKPTVGKDGILTGVTLRINNEAAFTLGSCTVTIAASNTYANHSACAAGQVCLPDLGTTGGYGCFACDSDCDCDSDEFCLLNTNIKEYGVCVSNKNIIGKTCTRNAFTNVATSGLTNGAAILRTDITNCGIGGSSASCINNATARAYNNALEQVGSTCGYVATFTTSNTADNSFNTIIYSGSSATPSGIGSQIGGSAVCVSGKCRQCNPWSSNNCGGGCAAGCTGAGDLNVRAQCSSGGSVSYKPRAASPSPLGVKSGAAELAVGATLVAASAVAALLF